MKMAALPPLSRTFTSEIHPVQEGLKGLSSTPRNSIGKANDYMRRRRRSESAIMLSGSDKISRRRSLSSGMLQKEVLCPILCCASESDDYIVNHQRSVETYFEKLQSESKGGQSTSAEDVSELEDRSSQVQEGLMSLERYLSNLKEDAKSEESTPSTSGRNPLNVAGNSAILDAEGGRAGGQKGFSRPRYKRDGIYSRRKSASPMYDEQESGHLYLISTLLSINIAVFLFEIASPVKNSDYNLFSLPLMYGAKVNDLILGGEWWRLVTPMFLHSGLLHILLSSWVLLSFGPRVCKGYGSFTFVLIYILGGISGNFSSFLHTSDPTVGGTGPVFAIVGAWLIYQIQNKNVDEKEVSETMFQKAVIATTLSCVLSYFGPIDNWTNLGAVVSGIVYGYFTRPVVQVNQRNSNSGLQETMKEEISLLRQQANPCKSLVIFAVCLSALTSLLLLPKTPLVELGLEELLRL